MHLANLKKYLPFFAIFLAHLIWAVNFLVAKVTLTEIPPMSLGFLRFLLAGLLLLPFLLTHSKPQKIRAADIPNLFILGALMSTFHIALFYLGITKTSVSSASTLTATIPVLSVTASWIFLKEKIYTVNLVGILLGLIGVISIIGLPLLNFTNPSDWQTLLGNLLILLSVITWIAGSLFSKKLSATYSALTLTAVIFLVGTVTFIIPALNEYATNPLWVRQLSLIGILGLVYISFASSVSAYFLFEWGLSKLGVIKTSLFQYTEPVFAIVLAVLILGEQLRVSLVVGAILVGVGVYLGTLGKSEHHQHKAHRG